MGITPATQTSSPRLRGAVLLLLALAPAHAHAENLVPNPGFEDGNTGFTSAYHYQRDLFPSATYYIGGDPSRYNENWTNGTLPHGGARMMIINGAEVPDVEIWATGPLTIKPRTTYFFSFYAASIHPASPAILSFSINGEQIGKDFRLTPAVGFWQQACVPWNSGGARRASIAIVNQNTAMYGNDFALDDISFGADQFCNTEPMVRAMPHAWLASADR